MSNQALKTKQNSKRGRGTLAKHVTSACQSQKIFAQGHLKKNDTLSRRAISERATINAKEVNDCWQTFFFAFFFFASLPASHSPHGDVSNRRCNKIHSLSLLASKAFIPYSFFVVSRQRTQGLNYINSK